jgi:four helix bundle protein
MGFEFRDTDVYKLALEYNRRIEKLLNETKPGKSISDQFERAANSILLNIAEGFGRFHKADKRHYYIMARGSLYECVACSDIVFNSNPPTEFIEKSEIIGKMLSGLIKRFN